MSETMKAALDAALRFHDDDVRDLEKTVETAKRFHQELANAAPGAAEDWDESWFSRVGTWLASLSGDQLGSVRGQLTNLERSRQPVMVPVAPPGAYVPVPPPPGAPVPEAWALLDQLNGPQPYPGTTAPIGPLVTRDELERELAKLGGDRNNADDVQRAAEAIDSGNPPTAVPGTEIRVRPEGADPFTSTTYAAQLQHGTEGFYVLIPPGTFAEGRNDEIGPESAAALMKVLQPAYAGTVRQGTTLLSIARQVAESLIHYINRIKELETTAKADEEQLRGILGALPGYEDHDTGSFAPEETSIDAARRIMHELGQARARLRDLES